MQKKVYVIGVGGIGVSAIARYYNHLGYIVFGSDSTDSELIATLQDEGVDIIIGSDKNRIDSNFDLVIYTEAIPETQEELKKAKEIGVKVLSYPQALANISNDKKLIAITGTHGKSTTTSLTSIMLQNSDFGVNAVIGTILKEFGGKNTHFSESEYFAIEACEYKRSFLNYTPYIGVITNIELDHLDYYKDLDDYLSAFKDFVNNIKSGGYIILNGEDENCNRLLGLRDDITYIQVFGNYYSITPPVFQTPPSTDEEKKYFPVINMKVPGGHVLFDAHLAYVVGNIIGVKNDNIKTSLEGYTGVWRRMEIIGQTKNNNLLISDYGHHPTEIKLTLGAIKQKHKDKKIVTIFQPHQYNRTIELLEGFKTSFSDTDTLIIPNIYESRDSDEDKRSMSTIILLDSISHMDKYDGQGLESTLSKINTLDKNNNGQLIFVLLGAGDVDNLRYKIKTS